MSDDRHPYTSPEIELLRRVSNDYESLETIRNYWEDDLALPPVEEIIRSLRELQRKGWVQCYKYVLDAQEFVPIPDFPDEETLDPKELTGEAKFWWLITETGLAVLRKQRHELGGREMGEH